MSSNIESIRHQLIVLARRKKSRALRWPCDWRPATITNPASGAPFTEPGAWEYIAELLEKNIEIQEKILDEPEEGKKAYIIEAPLGSRTLYIKLQLGSGYVIGRSFHYSEYESPRNDNGS